MRKIRILIVDDHGIVRRGLRLQLEQNSGFEVVAEAGEGREAVRLAEELLPDVVIMDIAMPHLNGIQATAQLVKKNPNVGVIILSMHSDEVPVGTLLTKRPPDRTVRAAFPHTAPTSDIPTKARTPLSGMRQVLNATGPLRVGLAQTRSLLSSVRHLPSSGSSAFALFAAFLGTMSRSDSSAAYMSSVWPLPSQTGLMESDTAEVSRFPFRKFPNMHGVFDYAGTGHDSRSIAMSPVAFLMYVQSRRPGGSFRSSISQPVGAAVYASTCTSRCTPQNSRPKWFATPFFVGLFHPQLSAGLPAHTYLTRTLAAGAKGYLLKESAEVDLPNAVRAVAQGKPFFSPAIANTLLEDHMRELKQRGLQDTYDLLTEREKEVLQLLAEGKSNKDVATLLNLSVNTVETHRTRIMQKLNLHTAAEIVLYAVRKRIIS